MVPFIPDTPARPAGSRGPVLLVEPDPRQAIGLVRTLAPFARVRLASGLADAREAAAVEAPELLLVSDRLPEAGVVALLRACRADAALADTPVVVMLSEADERAEVAALAAGAVACLPRHAGPVLAGSRLRAVLTMVRSAADWRERAQHDALTGLASRRQLDAVLRREWRRAHRQQRPLALLMVDLDHFKAYNDRHGHLAGDGCLHEVAQILMQSLRRPTDLAGRFGGEEFAVLLSETDMQGGLVVADLLLRAVDACALPHGGQGAGPWVSVSIGVSAWLPGHPAADVTALVASADSALYAAKRQGRARVGWRAMPGADTAHLPPADVLPLAARFSMAGAAAHWAAH